MEQRVLGSSGIVVAEIGRGCMSMSWAYVGDGTDEESAAVVRRALDLRVTLLDSADVYGPFTNEDLVGRALGDRRPEAVLATKVGLVVGPKGGYPLRNDARPERTLREVDGSLRRPRTDVIDLCFLHRVDRAVPLEESRGAMASLVQAGKVRAIGLSEVEVDQLEENVGAAGVDLSGDDLAALSAIPEPVGGRY